MDEQTRKAIEDVLSLWGVGAKLAREPLDETTARLDAFLRDALAREAEHTTPVSPEWMDGAEARRLGFVGDGKCWWTLVREDVGEVKVGLVEDGWLCVADSRGHSSRVVRGIPTIAQVRAAVFLATGRR